MLPDFSGRCRFRRTSTWRIRHQYHGNDLQCECNKGNLSMDCRRQELDIILYLPITMKLIDGALSWTVWKQIVDTDDCPLHKVTILSEKSVIPLFPIPHVTQFGLLNAIGSDTWTTLLIGASVVPHCLICGVIANNTLDRMGLSFWLGLMFFVADIYVSHVDVSSK